MRGSAASIFVCKTRPAHPGADRLSFVFLETEDAPFLDGRLVQVDRRQDHAAEIIRQAAFYLRSPGPIARLSRRLDRPSVLLGEVLLVGDFWWRRFEDMQGYLDYREVFSHVQNTMGTSVPSKRPSMRSLPRSRSTPSIGATRSPPAAAGNQSFSLAAAIAGSPNSTRRPGPLPSGTA